LLPSPYGCHYIVEIHSYLTTSLAF
jgi:hypothetical protein